MSLNGVCFFIAESGAKASVCLGGMTGYAGRGARALVIVLVACLPVLAPPYAFTSRVAAGEAEGGLPANVDWNAVFRNHFLQRTKSFREQNCVFQYVVLLGDSLTEGFDVAVYFPGRRFLNRGIGGDVLGVDLSEDDPRGVLRRLPESVYDCQATDVFVLIGINDLNQGRSPDSVARGQREVMESLSREVPRTRVHMQSLLPTRGPHASKNADIVECNRRLEAMAKEYKINYVDLHSRFCDSNGELRADFTEDGLHLTPAAYAIWRDEIDRVLRTLPTSR